MCDNFIIGKNYYIFVVNKDKNTVYMKPIINSRIPEFSVQAYHNGEFKTVTDNDV